MNVYLISKWCFIYIIIWPICLCCWAIYAHSLMKYCFLQSSYFLITAPYELICIWTHSAENLSANKLCNYWYYAFLEVDWLFWHIWIFCWMLGLWSRILSFTFLCSCILGASTIHYQGQKLDKYLTNCRLSSVLTAI